jgi:undecaprenyl-diphosphatase
MTILQALILGIVQGLTEFLPISSSGHLVLVPHLLNWQIPEEQVFVFDVLVQLGTLAAVIVYFWKDLWHIFSAFITNFWRREAYDRSEVRLGWYILLATIPAVVLGLLFKDIVEAAFSHPRVTAMFLAFTALLLIAAESVGKRVKSLEKVTWLDSLIVGFFQALAVFPGVSRSGATITGGMARDMDRPTAARFSFLIAVPVMIGAGALTIFDLFEVPNLGDFIAPMAIGFIAAGVVGYLSIHWLLRYLTRNRLYYFAVYLVLVSTLVLVFK